MKLFFLKKRVGFEGTAVKETNSNLSHISNVQNSLCQSPKTNKIRPTHNKISTNMRTNQLHHKFEVLHVSTPTYRRGQRRTFLEQINKFKKNEKHAASKRAAPNCEALNSELLRSPPKNPIIHMMKMCGSFAFRC